MNSKKIVLVRTLGTMYDRCCIEVATKEKDYRLDVRLLVPFLKNIEFEEQKKKVHTYLIPKKR